MSVELPRDAEGREVPLDTKTLYDEYGRPIKASAFSYSPEFKNWLMRGWFNAAEMSSRVSKCYLTPPDSWEKLEEDLCAVEDYANTTENDYLDSPSCIYAHSTGKSCGSCKLYGGTSCTGKMCADIASRIRKLRGED